MSHQSKLLPDGHIEVASYCNGESALVSYFVATLSRDQDGYCLTQTIGEELACAGSELDKTWLHQGTRSLTTNEAILWLEREISYARARGHSPYCRHSLSLDRREIRRLLANNRLESWFYSNISELLIKRVLRVNEVRFGQIPHPKIFFTDQERDLSLQIADAEKPPKESFGFPKCGKGDRKLQQKLSKQCRRQKPSRN